MGYKKQKGGKCMDDMENIYRDHAQTVYKFLLAQCGDPDLAHIKNRMHNYIFRCIHQKQKRFGRYDPNNRQQNTTRYAYKNSGVNRLAHLFLLSGSIIPCY